MAESYQNLIKQYSDFALSIETQEEEQFNAMIESLSESSRARVIQKHEEQK